MTPNPTVPKSAIPTNLRDDIFVQKLLIQLDYETKLRQQAEQNADLWKQQAQTNLDIANKAIERGDKYEKAWNEERSAGLADNKAAGILQSQNIELIKDNQELRLDNERLKKDKYRYGIGGFIVGAGACYLTKDKF